MKSKIVGEEEQEEIKYPCLFINRLNNKVVLFTDNNVATIMHMGSSAYGHVGLEISAINSRDKYWEFFKGTVELSNDKEYIYVCY